MTESSPNVIQVSLGRFHHFHLARQLEKYGLLKDLYTGYPRFKLTDERGIPVSKIKTFPWLQTPYMALGKMSRGPRYAWLSRNLAWHAHQTLDRYVASKISDKTILIALSGSGLNSGRRAKSYGGIHICDRGSSHIRFQNQLLSEEYRRYGAYWPGIDPRLIDREEAEYHQADYISIPSQFCVDSFLDEGIAPDKLIKIPYGSRLERFYPDPIKCSNCEEFRILFVGKAGPRKGFIDLLQAFRKFSHPQKRVQLIGSFSQEAKDLIASVCIENIDFIGSVPNAQLRKYYSEASVFVLPSVEEGLAMVLGEAMACGCPVIASTNTGASELITDGVEGFIVPIRSPEIIADRLQQLADQPELRERMGQAALARVKQLGGWDTYGSQWKSHLLSMIP